MWLGTIMLFNVWVLIWPNQKKILGIVPATDEEKAKARKIALHGLAHELRAVGADADVHGVGFARPAVLSVGRAAVRPCPASHGRAREDVGSGDVTASLIDAGQRAHGRRHHARGRRALRAAWVDETFRQLDPGDQLTWHCDDGARIGAGPDALRASPGRRAAILTGERTALNFLQLLSATATEARRYVDAVAGTGCTILDTRKTLPGLRHGAEIRRALRRREQSPHRACSTWC